MSKIPTWEELESSGKFDDYGSMYRYLCRLHVKQALEAAAEKLPYDDRCNQDHMLKQSILNAYPESNIK